MKTSRSRMSAVLIGVMMVGLGSAAWAEHKQNDVKVLDFGKNAVTYFPVINRPDIYQFELDQGRRVTISSEDFPGQENGPFGTNAELLDSSGQVIAEDDDGGPFGHFRISQELDPGVYTLRVKADATLPRGEDRLLYYVTMDHE